VPAVKRFYFDLDGPLLDVSEKYHRVYADWIEAKGAKPMEKSAYWEARRRGVPDAQILEQAGLKDSLTDYLGARKRRIETAEYLRFDRIWRGAEEMLSLLQKRYSLVLVTLRASRPALARQLAETRLDGFFENVLCVDADAQNTAVAMEQACRSQGYECQSWISAMTADGAYLED